MTTYISTKNNAFNIVLIILTILFSITFIFNTFSKAETPVPKGNLVGYVWDDFDINGFYDNNENGLSNLQVNLLNPNTTDIVTTAYTDTKGNYTIIANVGTYDLQFINPAGYEIANSEKFLTNIENNILKGVKIPEPPDAFKALVISTAFVTTNNPNVKFNKFFNSEFNDKFNKEFNADFNKKYNDLFNKVFMKGYEAGLEDGKNMIEIDLS